MPVISTNLSANSALRYLNINSEEQTSALNKVASGSRITRAADDAAGLAVSTKLQSDVAILGQAATNASHAVAVLQTADGGLAAISDILERMKVLAGEAMSGAVSDDERAYIDSEFDQLVSEIDTIVNTTTFNGTKLLNMTDTLSFLVGTGSGTVTESVIVADLTGLGVGTLGTGTLSTNSLDTYANAETALGAINTAIDTLAQARATVGSYQSRFDYHAAQINNSKENLDAAQSAIADADIAEAQSEFSSAQVLTNAAIAALSQANSMPQQLLKLLQ